MSVSAAVGVFLLICITIVIGFSIPVVIASNLLLGVLLIISGVILALSCVAAIFS